MMDRAHGDLRGAVVDFGEDNFFLSKMPVEFLVGFGLGKIDEVDGGLCPEGFEGGGQLM